MEMVMSWPDSRRKKAAAAAEANAIIGAGKAARPCDGCLGKRARWYCPADDAFLCPACDSSVHAANQLAGRHDRLRLLPTPPPPHTSTQPPSWHAGFSRKSRTPRKHNKSNHHHVVADVVPDILTSNDDNINGDDDTDSPRVPVLDPLAFGPAAAEMEEEEEDYFSNMMMMMKENPVNMGMELDTSINFDDDFENLGAADDDQLILSPGMDLAELVADVEYLLDDDDDENVVEQALQGRIKEEEAAIDEEEDEDGYVKCEKKEEEEGIVCNSSSGNSGKIFLRLNYEDVIRAWGKQLGGSPNWTTTPNTPPSAGGLLLHHHPNWPLHHHHHNMINCPPGGGRGRGGAERVERVLRYKEKRRRRLFAKKIRYQVRKLNAENRPRFKGRFVKRI